MSHVTATIPQSTLENGGRVVCLAFFSFLSHASFVEEHGWELTSIFLASFFLYPVPRSLVAVEADAQKSSFKDENGVDRGIVYLTHRKFSLVFSSFLAQALPHAQATMALAQANYQPPRPSRLDCIC